MGSRRWRNEVGEARIGKFDGHTVVQFPQRKWTFWDSNEAVCKVMLELSSTRSLEVWNGPLELKPPKVPFLGRLVNLI